MKKQFRKKSIFSALFMLASISLFAQTTHIEGHIIDAGGEPLVGVNILVKDQVIGTVTDIDGHYAFDVHTAPPFKIIVSMMGFAPQEIKITDADNEGLDVTLEEQMIMGQEVVVSASRMEQSIMESPVSIEKMGILDIKNTASDSYYKAIANLKGVDMTSSSINFQIFNARGFNSTGNTRFVQLIDGMDTQAPALNFPVGSLNGPSELDAESAEFIPGAASALYGPNAFNGILLINSKNPFDYQGLSAMGKFSVNHINDSGLNSEDKVTNPNNKGFGPGAPQPMYETAIRYAKSFNNKFAFKVNFSYSKATDWYGTSMQDRNETSKPAGFSFNPGADRIHAFGDEVAVSLELLKASGAFVDGAKQLGLNPDLLPSTIVSRTPYLEQDIVDYNAKNIKYAAALFYRINDKIEVSYDYRYGGGTTVFTGAQRYSLQNFNIQSHKLEFRGNNFFVRGYATIENSENSFIGDLTGILINDSWKDNGAWFGAYGIAYLQSYTPSLDPNQDLKNRELAHQIARQNADSGRLIPGSKEFNDALADAKSDVIPNGSKFADKSALYHLEGQYNFKKEVHFMDLLAGASYQMYDLRSNGTIFADSPDNPITIAEFGAFAQASKALMDEKIIITGSLRYDKNENFKGQINPRLSAVIKAAPNHNIRMSFQTGFRNPTTQGQHVDLNVISARLLGGLPFYSEKYDIFTNAYTLASVNKFVNKFATEAGGDGLQLGNPDYLKELVPVSAADGSIVKPEQINSFELGYKSLINNKLMLDIVGYYNIYNDFITQILLRKASGDINIPQGTSDDPNDPNYWAYRPETEQNIRNTQSLLVPITTVGQENTFATYTNIENQITGAGAAIGIDYMLGRGYSIGGNYNWNKLIDSGFGENERNDFNTPEHKVNFSFGNRKVTDNLGFNLTYRWQTSFFWAAGFGTGEIPAVGTIDAQLNYKLSSIRSIIKVGGSNLLNTRYVTDYGGPTMGTIYYVSLTFDELLN